MTKQTAAYEMNNNGESSVHGGDVYRNDVELDFSVNLNPAAVPEEIMQAGLLGLSLMHQYPDPLQSELRAEAAAMEGVSADNIIFGSGASELLMAIVHAVMPERALITAPCYAGYAYVLGAARADIREYQLKEENDYAPERGILDEIRPDTDMVILADPNNPNGRLTDRLLMNEIRRKCREQGAVLIIDECFLPLTSRYNEKADLSDGAIHLRAFTKTFAVPGIRLGYILCGDDALTEKIKRHLPEWNVSSAADSIGRAAAKIIRDTDYLEQSVSLINRERDFLAGRLKGLGLKVYPADANYLLMRADEDKLGGMSAAYIYNSLLERKILVRRCANFHGLDDRYLRIAVRTHEDNLRLVTALAEILEGRQN